MLALTSEHDDGRACKHDLEIFVYNCVALVCGVRKPLLNKGKLAGPSDKRPA